MAESIFSSVKRDTSVTKRHETVPQNLVLDILKFNIVSDRARLHTLAGGNPAQEGEADPLVASHGMHAAMGALKR
jgi:hypothetical protein